MRKEKDDAVKLFVLTMLATTMFAMPAEAFLGGRK